MKPVSNRASQAARLFVLLALLCFAFAPLWAQEAAQPAGATSTAPSAQPAAPAVQAAKPQQVPLFYEDAPEADRAAVTSARALADSGKWLSAWKLLAEYDAANADPWILAEKIRLADSGYAQTIMHLGFGFVDLKEGEDLESLRYGGGEGIEVADFKPGDLAAAIEASGAAVPAVLSLALGDYYYEVWSLYKGQWMEEDATILGKGAEQYERALAYETFSAESLGRHSDILMALQRWDAAEKVVRKALELGPGSFVLSLKLGDILYGMSRWGEVYPLADELIAEAAKAADQNGLNDAFILAIKTGLGAGDRTMLDKYLAAYEAGFPDQYMPGLVRHLVMVRLGDAAAADAAADALDNAFPGNPEVIRSLLSTWLSANDSDSGFRYLERCLAKNPADEPAAALHFYKALLGYQAAVSIENVEAALADLAKAEELFKKVYPAEHQVFGTIGELRAQWNEALASAKEGAAAESSAAPAASDGSSQGAAAQAAAPAQAPASTAAPAADGQAQPAATEGADATSSATE